MSVDPRFDASNLLCNEEPAALEKEEMLVAALSVCHMLVFLHLARQAGFVISTYRDQSEGVMGEIADGQSGHDFRLLAFMG